MLDAGCWMLDARAVGKELGRRKVAGTSVTCPQLSFTRSPKHQPQHHGPFTDSAQRRQPVRQYNSTAMPIANTVVVAVAPSSNGKMSKAMRSAKTTWATRSWPLSAAGNKVAT
jgi:hypothetical protein